MPLYEVQHSWPLTTEQKTTLAESITKLHSRKFTTPSLFVNVQYHAVDASAGIYFVGGKPRLASANRIIAMVRTSEKRTKEHFDQLATKVEEAWYEVVNGNRKGEKGEATTNGETNREQSESERVAKELRFVVFYPMITAREVGIVIPGAGQEGNWLLDNMSEFKKRADAGNEEFVDILKEIEERDDLKKLVS